VEARPEYAVSFGLHRIIDDKGNNLGVKRGKYRSGWIFKDLLFKKFSIIAPTAMVKLSVVKELGGYSKEFAMEDLPMWLEIAQKHQMGFIDKVLINYRTHTANTTKNYTMRLEVQRKLIEKYKNTQYYKEALQLWHLRSFDLLSGSEKKKALPHLLPSLKFFYTKRFRSSFKRLFV